jgi:isoamylase
LRDRLKDYRSLMRSLHGVEDNIAANQVRELGCKVNKLGTKTGTSFPLGASLEPGGVNFSVYSRNAKLIELVLFDGEDAIKPSRVIPLNAAEHRTYHYWHVFVPNLTAGQMYGFRATGPFDPEQGLRYDNEKVLLDPYGRAVAIPKRYSRVGYDSGAPMKSIVTDTGCYDWEGDRPLHRPFVETVIYELHVRGFTCHPSSRVAPDKAGTYAGLIEKIPYLVDLGITAVELMPVFQFDACDAPVGRVNYWGYSPVSFFAPHRAYSSRQDPLGPMDEFRDMVKALHRAGIEVILDVVFNHTAEGGQTGPTFCWRGLENATYYLLERDLSRYADYTGTGNTLNANNPIVRRMILDSLHHWVCDMHVDGFRFDLASVLSRDESGAALPNPPLIWDIESDPALAGTKVIAEAWDVGLYQVGSFVGDSWQEWNGRFRDDVRRFLKGDRNTVSNLAARLLGSPDIYAHEKREPEQSINFVTCHDGFTLNDLVSYNQRHNEDNGEDNRDGMNDNSSWNCGVEGPVENPQIDELRRRQIKNFLALLMIAVGTPMLLMGDEVRRTQHGNNNAYCQDNEISWLDWSLPERHVDIHRFVKMLIEFRGRRDVALSGGRLTLNELLEEAQLQWHGVALDHPDWSEDSHSIAFTISSRLGRFVLHVMLNAYWEPLTFELPATNPQGARWRRWVDTSLPSPQDICAWEAAQIISESTYVVVPRSIVLLIKMNSGPPQVGE